MRILSILRKDLLILLRDRAEMAVLFLMPLAFIIPISLALGKGDGYGINRNNKMIPLVVVNYDGGPRAQTLITYIGESLAIEKEFDARTIKSVGLEQDADCVDFYTALTAKTTAKQETTENPVQMPPACAEKIGHTLLQRSGRVAMLVIPQGFSTTIDSAAKAEVTLVYDPAGDSIRMQQVEGVVKGATVKLSLQNQLSNGLGQMSALTTIASPDVRNAVETEASSPVDLTRPPAITLKKVSPENFTGRPTPDTYQQTIPGYAVMYVFFIITTMSASIRQEKLNGTFRRLLSAPIGRAEILGGKMLATMLVGVLQVLILFIFGAIFFHLGLGNDPLAFLVLTIALVAAATAIGLAASTTQMRGAGLGVPLVVAALLGGCMFPLDLMPPFLRTVSYFVPHSWALAGYQNLLVRGQGLEQILPQVAVLLLFAALFFFIAIRRFDFEA
jgi:ABC-2 type transport system permease protein